MYDPEATTKIYRKDSRPQIQTYEFVGIKEQKKRVHFTRALEKSLELNSAPKWNVAGMEELK